MKSLGASLHLGAAVRDDGVVFRAWAPRCRTLDVVIEGRRPLAMSRQHDGLCAAAVELMPVAEFPGSRNWGYDGVHLFAAQSTYGGPRGLRRLVGACHAHGLSVILDVVYNHLGPEGNYLGEFGPFFTDRYRTPWG